MKRIWLFNHYATNMIDNRCGRHFDLAKELHKAGYKTTIFCASTIHNSNTGIPTNGAKYVIKEVGDTTFVILKTTKYKNNGLRRIINMTSFFLKLMRIYRGFGKTNNYPDLIYASSVHPLTLVAGILVSRRLKIPLICEIRDLWPESLVAYGVIKRNSLFTKLLYQGEKWIYKNSTAIIMTWEGGMKYIIDKKWNNKIDLSKVYHISQGISLDTFDYNCKTYIYTNDIFTDKRFKNCIYAGSIRKVNNIGILLDVAKIIYTEDRYMRFIILGDGNETIALKERCFAESILNVVFISKIDKKKVPSILENAHLNILHNTSSSLNKYGQSQNKLFEYLASSRPVIQTYYSDYSVIQRHSCGLMATNQTPESISHAILTLSNDSEKYAEMCYNAREAAKMFDYSVLGNKLISIVDSLIVE